MRTIESSAYGTIEIEDQQVYHFEAGILGLPDIREYALIPMQDTTFYILHSTQTDISFVLVPANQAVQDYSFQLNTDIVEMLHISSSEDVAVMLVVNVTEDQLYANLLAPVLFAPESLVGCQYIIKDQELPLRHPLLRKEGD
ncbi:flagellar assembly protein FliW [Paenibacillus senegalimassiliensis]|uniref:flagellar assembly protein FliW n=1 Tax=Paenibacillus senegalimassiliensis TaxID=1737426 RepID=UPI00073F1A1C|nr:flagellar assembly protein FliW [Paenibacillus senegalimassiliensis]